MKNLVCLLFILFIFLLACQPQNDVVPDPPPIPGDTIPDVPVPVDTTYFSLKITAKVELIYPEAWDVTVIQILILMNEDDDESSHIAIWTKEGESLESFTCVWHKEKDEAREHIGQVRGILVRYYLRKRQTFQSIEVVDRFAYLIEEGDSEIILNYSYP
jgi:hypothetical protein